MDRATAVAIDAGNDNQGRVRWTASVSMASASTGAELRLDQREFSETSRCGAIKRALDYCEQLTRGRGLAPKPDAFAFFVDSPMRALDQLGASLHVAGKGEIFSGLSNSTLIEVSEHTVRAQHPR
jgi:hypothetical protein